MESTDSLQTCAAVLEQGANKGKKCWRPISKDGYCGKHQTIAILEKGKADGKKKCMKHRCTVLVEPTETYCENCIKEKEEIKKTKKICKAIVQQHDHKGLQCDKLASNGDYCGKHFERNSLVESAKKSGTRICDDGKRSCTNLTENNKLLCETCLEKNRGTDRKEYQKRQLDEELCLGCGKKMEVKTEGFKKETVQRCIECYEKLKEVEKTRERKRDYDIERKQNIMSHYNEYVRSAIRKNLEFSIDIDEFERLVNSHCHYCNDYDPEKVIGIDRVDSSKGYKIDNVVGCCCDCNRMKGDSSVSDFKKKILKISAQFSTREESVESADESVETSKESFIRPKKIVELYYKRKLPEYVELCKKDERSSLFIKKIEDLIPLKLNEHDCIRYVKNALQSEAHSVSLTQTKARHRVSKLELFTYLEQAKPEKCVELYESAHGKDDLFKKDITELSKEWNEMELDEKQLKFTKLLVKFQNQRNRK